MRSWTYFLSVGISIEANDPGIPSRDRVRTTGVSPEEGVDIGEELQGFDEKVEALDSQHVFFR